MSETELWHQRCGNTAMIPDLLEPVEVGDRNCIKIDSDFDKYQNEMKQSNYKENEGPLLYRKGLSEKEAEL